MTTEITAEMLTGTDDLIVRGRYVLEGETYMRVSNIADMLDDKYMLELWKQRMIAKGMAARPDLPALAATLDVDNNRDELNKLCNQAIEAARTVDRGGLGTALHRITEHTDKGGDINEMPANWHPHINAYNQALQEYGIQIDPEGVERVICHDTGGLKIAGTADRLPVIWHGRRYVADLKTAKNMHHSWLKTAIQLAIYANHTHTYNKATKRREPPLEGIDKERAMVFHMPSVVEGDIAPRCDIYMLDIAAGYQAFLTALEVREWRSTPSSKLVAPIGAFHIEGTAADTPAWFTERGKAIQANPAALADLRRLWPAEVPPPPLPAVLTDTQSAALDRAMSTVEAAHQIPFTRLRPGAITGKSKTKANSKGKAA